MEETDQAKDQGKYTKRVWDEMGQKTKSRKIKDDKWERKKKKTVQRRYSQGHHQNQAAVVGPNTELLPKRKSKHCAHYMKKRLIQQNRCLR